MDKASASGAGDSRFESWAGHAYFSLLGTAVVRLLGGTLSPVGALPSRNIRNAAGRPGRREPLGRAAQKQIWGLPMCSQTLILYHPLGGGREEGKTQNPFL